MVDLGFQERLDQNMSAALRKITDRGLVPGNAIMIGKNGKKIYEKYHGYVDKEHTSPIDRKTLYRMYSMTKVVTVVAALQLWEQGKFQLDDLVSSYLPEYQNLTVLQADGTSHAAKNAMTMRHLLTMTSGIGYFDSCGYYADFAKQWDCQNATGKSWDTIRVAKEFAKLPLLFEPGEKYCYGFSYDVLGALIEIISGLNLRDYCKRFIFEPLGMMDSDFEISESDKSRMAVVYRKTPEGLTECQKTDVPILNVMRFSNPAFYSGGAGLVSTLEDYFIFTGTLAEGGGRNGVRILKEDTVAMMHQPQITQAQRLTYNDPNEDPSTFGAAYTYGFGVRVLSNPRGDSAVPEGEWGWSGALGTWMAIDPKEHMFFVYAHQHNPPMHKTYVPELWAALQKAIADHG